jgi:hypothetical protein
MLPHNRRYPHAERGYRHPLIATDLEDAGPASSVLRLIDSSARIVLVSAYRIPWAGLHTLLCAGRLMRAIHARTTETMDAFARSSSLDRASFELLARPGDIDDLVLDEIRARPRTDLAVLALGDDSAWARFRSRKLAARILDLRSCDIAVASADRSVYQSHWVDDCPLALGPW